MKTSLFIISLAAVIILSACGKQDQTGNETTIDTATDAVTTEAASVESTDTPDTSAEDSVIAPMAPSADGDTPSGDGKQTMQLISLEQAKAAALSYANISEADATFRDFEQELDDGRYEFEFTANGVEYEIYVAGGTGEITGFKTDKDVGIENFPAAVQEPTAPTVPTSPVTSPDPITPDDAKTIAVKHAGVKVSSISDYKLEFEDGLYEIEFNSGSTEYEFEINAYTGEIVKYETDID